MINLDGSIIPAIVIFLVLIVSLNQLLFKPLMRIQAERESRTTGLVNQAHERMNYQSGLFKEYQASVKNARMEGYRRQEQLRAEAVKKRMEMLAQARASAEQMVRDSRVSIQSQVEIAKHQLALDAQELAERITSTILGKAEASL